MDISGQTISISLIWDSSHGRGSSSYWLARRSKLSISVGRVRYRSGSMVRRAVVCLSASEANRRDLRSLLRRRGTPKAHIIKIIQERGKQKARSLLLVAYLATILAIIVITAMAVYRASEVKIPPKLVGSSVERHRP